MNDNLIIIPSEDEVTEKISLNNPEISAEETLKNILPAQENFENPLAFNENIFKYIDSLQNAKSLKYELLQINNLRIKNIFWESFKKFKRRARLTCAYINRCFFSSIPLSENINRFVTPHHFYGIFISEGVLIGDNVYIGSGAKIVGKRGLLRDKRYS